MKLHTAALLAILIIPPWLSPAAIKEHERNVIEEAEQALRNRDPEAALKALNALIEKQPENAAAYFWRGRLLAEQGHFEKAINDLDESIRLEPRNADAYAHRGYARTRRNEPDEALTDFNRALRRYPNNEFAL